MWSIQGVFRYNLYGEIMMIIVMVTIMEVIIMLMIIGMGSTWLTLRVGSTWPSGNQFSSDH